ncbi:alpha/beta hydrolase family protein [Paenibacillus sp. GYB003]|uniref:alpha/beta hydrolase family protein n=1 Tax=Paenibacillus sp. GYB003 TaxID=2994392 RepID=UPI002F967279
MYLNKEAYLSNLARSGGRTFDYRKAAESGGWADWRREFRLKLRELLGMRHIEAPADLRPACEETEELDAYTLEKWHIATEPGIVIPFYLLLPRGKPGPFPLVIAPHGHGRRGKEVYVGRFADDRERSEALEGDRDIALQAVGAGYAVIAPDVRGFWEMAAEEDMARGKANSCETLQRSALMYGRTLIGERVHDMGRLIDYAATRGEIDVSRIAITGNSGGGTVSLFTAALDERVGVAVPGSYFCTFERSIVPIHHCPCNIVPGMLQLGEMYDVAGLIAPRPILVVHGRDDAIYPIEGTREAFDHLRNVYRSMGAEDRCELYVGQGGHRYYKERVWDFVGKHLG